MIKVFIFDLGGVLFTNGTKKFISFASKKYGVEKHLLEEELDGNIGTLYREAKISRDEFWQEFIGRLHIDATSDELEKEWINSYELITGTKELILKLSKQYRIYFLSDNVKERIDQINAKFGFLQWFAGGVFSYEIGVRKPHPQIYKMVLEKAKVQPEEAVFIDDKPHFLLPAQQLGMQTVVFKTPENLRDELQKKKLFPLL